MTVGKVQARSGKLPTSQELETLAATHPPPPPQAVEVGGGGAHTVHSFVCGESPPFLKESVHRVRLRFLRNRCTVCGYRWRWRSGAWMSS